MRVLLATLALAAGLSASSAAKRDEQGCAMLPPKVTNNLAYSSGPSGYLCATRQKPIWHGLPEGTKRVTRFVFTQGHGSFFRYATISEQQDGKAQFEAGGADMPFRKPRKTLEPRIFSLSAGELARIEELVAASGTFEHEVGSWDDHAIYLHCELLEMERAEASGYHFASVNIGCNQPRKLMPLVKEIMRLAHLSFEADGQIIR